MNTNHARAVTRLMQLQSAAQAIPFHTNGMRIGLLGGSFNPPHAAHRAISLFALKRLKLDRVWWLLTPGNPLKDTGRLHGLSERARAALDVADDPRIDISCLEAVIGVRYTVDTIIHLRRRVSGVHFVWIMGADNLAQFHRWKHWRRIASEVPIAVIDRPPQSFRALAAPAAQALARYRVPENQAARLADQQAPAWVFLTGMKLNLSSTGLRNSGRELEGKEVTVWFEPAGGIHWNIETINPTCLIWSADVGIRRSRYSERNGPWPHLYCPSPSLFYPRLPARLLSSLPRPRVKHRHKLRP